MPRKVDWDSQLGRRLKLRDLHVFFTVAARGSTAKAAAQLVDVLENDLGVPVNDPLRWNAYGGEMHDLVPI